MSDYEDYNNLAFDPHKQELLEQVAAMDLRDQLDAEKQISKRLKETMEEWKKLFNKIDTIYSWGVNQSYDDPEVFVLTKSVRRLLNQSFGKWEKIRND